MLGKAVIICCYQSKVYKSILQAGVIHPVITDLQLTVSGQSSARHDPDLRVVVPGAVLHHPQPHLQVRGARGAQ